MRRRILFVILLLLPLHIFAQTSFKKGYCIYNDGAKKECYLQNHGNENVGEDFVMKLPGRNEASVIAIKEISEFGVEGHFKFVRKFIEVDVSADHIRALKDTLDHEVIEYGHVYLLQLVGSDIASLYYFIFGGKEYFFIGLEDEFVTLLKYKKYYLEVASGVTSQILYDNRFKLQLKQFLPCSAGTETLSYTMKSLTEYVKTYIDENGGKVSVSTELSSGKFNANLSASANRSSFSISDGEITNLDFGSLYNISYGAKLEYLLPFNKNMLGIFSEVNYLRHLDSYSGYAPGILSVIDYRLLEFPVGLNYNLYLTEKFKIFFNIGVAPNIILEGSAMIFYRPSNSFNLASSMNMFVSGGLSYGIFSAEFRSYTSRNITPHLTDRGSVYEQFTIRFSFRVFQVG